MNKISQMTVPELIAELEDIKRGWARAAREIINTSENLLSLRSSLQLQQQQQKYGLPIEIKRAPDSPTRISGYASVFNVVDAGKDMVMPGAFTETLAKHRRDGTKPVMLWAHNQDEPIGVWDKITEDARGLYVEGRLLTTVQRASEAAALIDAGAASGLSIGYRVLDAENDSKTGVRKLLKIWLFEVSIVSIPMQSQARLSGKEYAVDDLHRAMDSLSRTVRTLTWR